MSTNNWGYFFGGMVTGIAGITLLACKDDIIDWFKYGRKRQAELPEDSEEEHAQIDEESYDAKSDPLYSEIKKFVRACGEKINIPELTNLIQIRFRLLFNKAVRFVEQMKEDGVITSDDGTTYTVAPEDDSKKDEKKLQPNTFGAATTPDGGIAVF